VEVKISRIFVVSLAEQVPLLIADASRPKPILQAQVWVFLLSALPY